MKITIKSNGKINKVKTIKNVDGTIHAIEFDFTPSDYFSDLELWLNDSKSDDFLDYAKMDLSKGNKMQFSK